MSEKDFPRFLRVILNVLLIGIVSFLWNSQTSVGTTVYSFTKASKSPYTTVCLDSDGNTRNHQEEWTESAGSCDRRICQSELKDILSFQLKYDCAPTDDYFDVDNCQYVSNTSLAFPDCCPQLECTNGTAPNDTVAACHDKSPTLSCLFWKSETNCVDSVDSILGFMYNLTVDYCNKTCGYCT